MTTTLEGGEGSASRPGCSLPPGKTRYPLYRRLGGPQGRSGQVRKISPPPGFDPRSVQPVASRYTNYAIRPTTVSLVKVKLCNALLLMALVCTYVYLQLYNISYEIWIFNFVYLSGHSVFTWASMWGSVVFFRSQKLPASKRFGKHWYILLAVPTELSELQY